MMKPKALDDVGAFAHVAVDLVRRGLRVVPTGGEDGKVPLLKRFTTWKKNPGPDAIAELSAKFPGANVAIVTGAPSKLAVVDVDDAALLTPALDRFGDTPLIVSTPSGGFHAYYRFAGEASDNRVLRSEGLAIDIRADGGLIVAPPSRNFLNGRAYSFFRGSWGDLSSLPRIKPGALPSLKRSTSAKAAKGAPVTTGTRNDALYREAMRAAHHAASLDALIADTLRINSAFSPPLDASEARKTAASAWRATAEGRNRFGGDMTANVTQHEFRTLKAESKNFLAAVAMLLDLRMMHRAGETFALVPEAYGERLAVGWRRARSARDDLECAGFIQRVKRGGRHPGDCHLYKLASEENFRGTKMVGNTNYTPPPPASPLSDIKKEEGKVVSLFGLRSSVSDEFDE